MLSKISSVHASMRNAGKSAKKFTLILVALVILLVIPIVVRSEYIIYILTLGFILSILSVGYNLMYGYTGILNFFWGASYCIGAYTSALITLKWGIPVWIAIVLSGLCSMGVSVLVSVVGFRLSDFFFWMITWLFAWLVGLLVYNEAEITGGPMGLKSIPPPEPILGINFNNYTSYYYLALCMLLLSVFIIHKIVKSNFGKVFISIREDALLSECAGHNTFLYKILSASFGSFFAGLAGSLYAHFIQYLHPSILGIWTTLEIICYLVVGGIGTALGPIIGTILMIFVSEFLRITTEIRMILFGLIIVIAVIGAPKGIWGTIKSKFKSAGKE